MTDRRQEEREALIASARTEGLAPHEADELSLLADLLGDPSTWAEPTSGLEDAVLQAVLDAPAVAGPAAAPIARRRPRLVLSLVAAAAAIAIVVGAVTVIRREPSPMFKSRLTAASPLAPAARANAEVYRNAAGFHVTLEAGGLAKLPAGEYYQAWLKNGSGILVPIGSFSSSDGTVTLWSGVSPREFNAMSVTIEKTDGNANSSGERVLAGPVLPN